MSAAREFLGYAERLEARALVASPGHAGDLLRRAASLRAAAARFAEREAGKRGGLPLFG